MLSMIVFENASELIVWSCEFSENVTVFSSLQYEKQYLPISVTLGGILKLFIKVCIKALGPICCRFESGGIVRFLRFMQLSKTDSSIVLSWLGRVMVSKLWQLQKALDFITWRFELDSKFTFWRKLHLKKENWPINCTWDGIVMDRIKKNIAKNGQIIIEN